MTYQLLVWMAGLFALGSCLACAADRPTEGPTTTRGAASQSAGIALKGLAEKRGMLFGVAAVGRLLADPESPYAKAVARECSVITPENDMKFGPLRPSPEKWNWGNADSLVEFAGKHGIKVHGHTLVWHEQVPKWVTEKQRPPQECRDLMLGHIETVVGRYRGKVYAWDVVNEAIEKDGTLRKTYWKDHIGDDYIDLAFRKAHEVDPKAKLVYNDYAMEGAGKKSDAVYNLVKGMKHRGVPIDAVGFQCHWEVGKYPAVEEIRANIKRFHDLGLEVWITELDLRVKVPSTPEDLARQAQAYASLVGMFVETGAVRSIQTWGLDDAHSWIPHFSEGYGDALLLDRDLRPKPAYFAIMKVFEGGSGSSSSMLFEKDIDDLVVGTPDDRMKSSVESLYSAGLKAFPTLIQHLGDLRPTDMHLRQMAIMGPSDGTVPHFPVGNICFEIILAQVEGHGWHQAEVEGIGPKVWSCYYVLTPENTQEWLSRHAGMTLKQLQVAAAEDELAKVKADPALATQPSVRRSAIELLQKHLEEVSSSSPFDKDIDNLVAGTPEARIKSSLETLRSAGVKAFASLIQHFGDSRLAEFWVFAREMVDITPDGRMKGHEPTIAEVCFDILQGQVEGNWPKAYRVYYVLTPGTAQLWLDMHAGMALKQLRIAAAEESLAKAKADFATQPSADGGAVEFLRNHLEEAKK